MLIMVILQFPPNSGNFLYSNKSQISSLFKGNLFDENQTSNPNLPSKHWYGKKEPHELAVRKATHQNHDPGMSKGGA